MKKNKAFAGALVLSLLAVIFTVLVTFVDVEQIGPAGTSVGFATINGIIFNLTGGGMNNTLYNITEVLGYAAISVALVFAAVGLYQLIKRKNILKVDRCIIVLAILYIVVAMIYVLFEKVSINFRPVILAGDTLPEASYPSSHTMLAVTVLGSCISAVQQLIKNRKARNVVCIASVVMGAVIVIGRLLSGVHWFTDIIGGLLISLSLVFWYCYFSQSKKD